MEYSFKFRDNHKDIQINIHQINSGHPGYSHEYSFLLWAFRTCRVVRPPRLLLFEGKSVCAFSSGLSLLSAVASLNVKTFMSNKKKVFTKCAARVAGGAPPRQRPRKCSAAAVVARANQP